MMYVNRIAPKVGDIYDLTAAEARQVVRACCINSGKYDLYEGEIITAIQLDGMTATRCDAPDDVEWSDVEISAHFAGRWHRVRASLCNETYGDYSLICCFKIDDDYVPARDFIDGHDTLEREVIQ